jgi:hypothetical protein
MPITKEEDKIHKALIKSQDKILKKMAQIEMDIHNHHQIHGGAIGIVDAFKNLGNTIKSGFEDKIINPVKQGFEEKIINPIENKIVNPIKENLPKSTQDFLDKIPDNIKNDPKFAKAIDYITKKKGGLASSLLHNGLPAATSAIVGGLSTIASGGNPLAGMAGSTAGGYAGKELSDYIGNKTGVGFRKKGRGMRGCGKNFPDAIRELQAEADKGGMGQQSAILRLKRLGVDYKPQKQTNVQPVSGGKIRKKRSKKYYSSSDSSSDSEEEYKRTRPNKNALQQLIEGHREQEAKEIKKGQAMLTRHQVEEMKFLRQGIPLEHVGDYPLAPRRPRGYGIKKLVGTKKGNRARGDIVAEVMKKQGLSLSQASKYVKEHNLY